MKDRSLPVRRNAIVYRCLTPDPAQALVFGGGATGGSVHMPDDSLYLLVSRGDIWDERSHMGAIAAVRVRGTPGLFVAAAPVRQECDLLAIHAREIPAAFQGANDYLFGMSSGCAAPAVLAERFPQTGVSI